MRAESEINATTKYVQTKFYLHKNYGTIGSCSLTTLFVHMCTNDDHKAL